MSTIYEATIYGSTNTSAADATGNGNTGTYVKCSAGLGATTIGQGASCALTSVSSVTLPTFGTNWTLAAFSVCMWVKIFSRNGASGDDLFSYYKATAPTEGLFLSHSFSATGDFRFTLRRNGSNVFSFATAALASLNTWAHVAFVYDGSGTGAAKVYVNGTAAAATGNGSTFPQAFTPTSKSIGAGPTGSNYTGLIDDFRIYNKALSSGEVTTLSTGAEGLTDSTLICRYKFEDIHSVIAN